MAISWIYSRIICSWMLWLRTRRFDLVPSFFFYHEFDLITRLVILPSMSLFLNRSCDYLFL